MIIRFFFFFFCVTLPPGWTRRNVRVIKYCYIRKKKRIFDPEFVVCTERSDLIRFSEPIRGAYSAVRDVRLVVVLNLLSHHGNRYGFSRRHQCRTFSSRSTFIRKFASAYQCSAPRTPLVAVTRLFSVYCERGR